MAWTVTEGYDDPYWIDGQIISDEVNLVLYYGNTQMGPYYPDDLPAKIAEVLNDAGL